MVDDLPCLQASEAASHLRVGALLGRGAFASVYDCTVMQQHGSVGALHPGAKLALKVLLARYCSSPEEQPQTPSAAMQRLLFLREAQTLHHTSHPHVVKCLGLVRLPGPGNSGSDSSDAHQQPLPGLSAEDGTLGMLLELGTVCVRAGLSPSAWEQARRDQWRQPCACVSMGVCRAGHCTRTSWRSSSSSRFPSLRAARPQQLPRARTMRRRYRRCSGSTSWRRRWTTCTPASP